MTELALALSARDWAERLHRFLADHGGARVRVNAFGPDDLAREGFDLLLIDDSCSFLSPRLVADVNRLGRRVIGVYDPAEFADGKDRLREVGVSDVIEAAAGPDEFLALISRVARDLPAENESRKGVVDDTQSSIAPQEKKVAVWGAAGGVGATEVAIAISGWLASQRLDVLLIDGDRSRPSVAQRLGLALHPNLLAAIDRVGQNLAPLDGVLQMSAGGFSVLPGAAWSSGDRQAVTRLVDEAASLHDVVIIDGGDETTDSGRGTAARIRNVVVGSASPVGLTRLLDLVAGRRDTGMDVVVNHVPRQRFRKAELVEELTRSYRPRSLALLPRDEVVERAAWSGSVVRSGRFVRAIDRWMCEVWVN